MIHDLYSFIKHTLNVNVNNILNLIIEEEKFALNGFSNFRVSDKPKLISVDKNVCSIEKHNIFILLNKKVHIWIN